MLLSNRNFASSNFFALNNFTPSLKNSSLAKLIFVKLIKTIKEKNIL
jgi:hypothetical protein